MNNSARSIGMAPRQMYACIIWALLLVMPVLAGCDTDPPVGQHTPTPTTTIAPYDGTIVALGDSLTAGLGVAETQAYPAQLAEMLKANDHHYKVINAGVSGETSSGARSRVEWVISTLKPDIVILETGANDGLRGIDPQLLETNLDQICTILKTMQIQVVLAGMRMLPNLGPEYIEAFATIYPRIAQKHDLIFMPFFLKGVAGKSPLNQADRIHPTAQGYREITRNLYPYIQKAITHHRSTFATKRPAAK